MNDKIRWTPETADAHILTASGNPYGNPPDVGRYLRYAFGEKGLTETLKNGTKKDIEYIHILLCAKIIDKSFESVNPNMLNLFYFSAAKITEKLNKLTEKNWLVFEPEPEKEISLA